MLGEAKLFGYFATDEDHESNRTRLEALRRFRAEFWDDNPKSDEKNGSFDGITATEADAFLNTLPKRTIDVFEEGTVKRIKRASTAPVSVAAAPWDA